MQSINNIINFLEGIGEKAKTSNGSLDLLIEDYVEILRNDSLVDTEISIKPEKPSTEPVITSQIDRCIRKKLPDVFGPGTSFEEYETLKVAMKLNEVIDYLKEIR